MTQFYATSNRYRGIIYDTDLPYRAEIKAFETRAEMVGFLYTSARSHVADPDAPWSAMICPGRWSWRGAWQEIVPGVSPVNPPEPFTDWEQFENLPFDRSEGLPPAFLIRPKAPVYLITGISQSDGVRVQWAPEHNPEEQE